LLRLGHVGLTKLGSTEKECLLVGFLRKQEERVAMRLLKWKYEKDDLPLPPDAELQTLAEQVVNEAHRIGKETGRSIVAIIKELVEELKKK
jgi:hypothetical protein